MFLNKYLARSSAPSMQGHPPLFGCGKDKFVLIFREKMDVFAHIISNTFQNDNKVLLNISVKT